MLRLRDCCSEFKSLARDFLQIGIKSAYALFSRVAIVNSYWPKNVFFLLFCCRACANITKEESFLMETKELLKVFYPLSYCLVLYTGEARVSAEGRFSFPWDLTNPNLIPSRCIT